MNKEQIKKSISALLREYTLSLGKAQGSMDKSFYQGGVIALSTLTIEIMLAEAIDKTENDDNEKN